MVTTEDTKGMPPQVQKQAITPVGLTLELLGESTVPADDELAQLARVSGASATWIETRSPRHVVAWTDQCQMSINGNITKLACWANDAHGLEGPNIRTAARLAQALTQRSNGTTKMMTVCIRSSTTPEAATRALEENGPTSAAEVRPAITEDGETLPIWHRWAQEPKTTDDRRQDAYTYEATAVVILQGTPAAEVPIADIVATLTTEMKHSTRIPADKDARPEAMGAR